MFNQTSFCLAVAHWGLHSLRPETLNEVIKGLFSSSLRLLFPSIWTCLEWALNFQVTETKDWGIPPQNETNGCVLFALAVNVSAPLMGCTGTEITGGQRAVRTQGSGPVTWTGHTPPALPAHQLKADHGGPGSNSALCYSGLMVLDDKKCAFFLLFFGLFVFFVIIIPTFFSAPQGIYTQRSWLRPELGWYHRTWTHDVLLETTALVFNFSICFPTMSG